jgi:hypothetical protein
MTAAAFAALALTSALTAGASAAPDVNATPAELPLRLQLDQDFREAVGLRADDAYVRKLASNRDLVAPGSRREYGALLTPEEQDQMERWDRLSEAMPIVYKYVERNAELVFGGAYISDQATGGIANVAFTQDSARHLQNIRREFPYPDRLRLFPVRRPLIELDALHDRVAGDIDALAREGITVHSVATDVKSNTVEIGVASADPETVRRLETRYGQQDVEVLEVPKPQTTSRSNQYPPMKSGLQIQNGASPAYSYRCTSAFSAYDVNFNYYMVTAGHCVERSLSWYSGVTLVGNRAGSDKFETGSNIDAGLVKLPSQVNASNDVYLSDTSVHEIYYQENYNYDSVGDRVRFSGISSDVVGGTVERRDYTATYDTARLYNQRLASFNSIPGDSGGGLFRENKAIGIMSGSTCVSCSTGMAIYSHIGYLRPAHDYEFPNLTIVKS